MRRPKILFYSHEGSRTGAPMFLLHFLRWLRKETTQDFEIVVGRGGPLEVEFAKLAKLHSTRTLRDRPELLDEFGLIYSNTCCNGLELEKLRYGGIPIITHVHELDYGIDVMGPRNFASVVKQSNHYVACAGIVAERLRRCFGIPAERISVFHEMVPSEIATLPGTKQPGENLRARYDIPKEAFVVMGCGTMDLRKGADLFVQLAAGLERMAGKERPLRFLWIGKATSPEVGRTLKHDIRRLGLESPIRFVGELGSPAGLLALGNVFCVTSREDPFPLVMLEAGLLGKPVVCFERSGGAPEYCRLGGGFAVPFLDVSAMAGKCAELMRSHRLADEVGARAADLVRSRFVVEAIAPGLWREISGFLDGAIPPAPFRAAGDAIEQIYRIWNLEEAPQRRYVLAYLARQDARRAARDLAANGRPGEAIQVLIRAVRADAALKDLPTLLECLAEVSGDLTELDSAKGLSLREEAIRLARMNGVPLESLMFRERLRPDDAAEVAAAEEQRPARVA